jgi:hypothetical protein
MKESGTDAAPATRRFSMAITDDQRYLIVGNDRSAPGQRVFDLETFVEPSSRSLFQDGYPRSISRRARRDLGNVRVVTGRPGKTSRVTGGRITNPLYRIRFQQPQPPPTHHRSLLGGLLQRGSGEFRPLVPLHGLSENYILLAMP